MSENTSELNREALIKLAGGNSNSRFKYTVPSIQFNGQTGKFSMYDPATKTETPIVDPLKIIILRTRRSYTGFEYTKDKKAISYFANEHDTWQDNVTVWKKVKGSDEKATVAFQGNNAAEIRENLPGLKFLTVMYVVYNNQVCRFNIKGASNKSFFEYKKKVEGEGKMLFDYTTEISSQQDSTGAITYYFTSFKEDAPTNLNTIAPFIAEVGTSIEKMNLDYSNSLKKVMQTATVELSDDDITYENPEDKEIKVEDIPW